MGRLSPFLATQSRIASILDWKKVGSAILSLDINDDRIGIAVAEHPSQQTIRATNYNNPMTVHALDPIQLQHSREEMYSSSRNKKRNRLCLDPSVVQDLESVVQTHKVCAFVVHWPLQPRHNGRVRVTGKHCGRVLHTLDSLVHQSNQIFHNSRPFCLYLSQDDNHSVDHPSNPQSLHEPIQPATAATMTNHCHGHDGMNSYCSSNMDPWGRSPLFAKLPPKDQTEYRSTGCVPTSQDSSFAADLLTGFLTLNFGTPATTTMTNHKTNQNEASGAATSSSKPKGRLLLNERCRKRLSRLHST